MNNSREIAATLASKIPTSLPFGEIKRLIHAALKEQDRITRLAHIDAINNVAVNDQNYGRTRETLKAVKKAIINTKAV